MKMKNPDKETLSQLMDGEWQDIDSQARIAELCSHPDLKATWARYHLIRDVMKNESVKVDTDIASRVQSLIADEPAHSNVTFIGGDRASSEESIQNQQTAQRTGWRIPAAGLAVAASVALATVVGLNTLGGGTTPDNAVQTVAALPEAPAAAVIPGQVLPQIELVANRGSYWVNKSADRDASREQRLNMFLSTHIENSPTASYQGMLPYSRLAGYDEVTSDQGTGQ